MTLPILTGPAVKPHLDWEFDKDIGRSKDLFVVAGPMYRAPVHWTGKADVGCRTILTEAKLRCGVQGPCPGKWVGYLPLFRFKDKRRMVAKLSESMLGKGSNLQPGAVLMFHRPEGVKKKLTWVHYPLSKEANDYADLIGRTKCEDIRLWLLKLWQDRLLTEAVGEFFIPSRRVTLGEDDRQTPVDPPGSPPADKPTPIPPAKRFTTSEFTNGFGKIH